MALIKCPECGNKVSEKAAACPRCGYPIAEYIASLPPEPDPEPEIPSVAESVPAEFVPVEGLPEEKGSVREKRFNLKVLLCCILGGLFITYSLYNLIRAIVWGESLFWIIMIYVTPILLNVILLFFALKKKKISLILSIAYPVVSLLSSILAVVLTPVLYPGTTITVGWFSYVATVLTSTLLILYATIGWHKRDSILWALLYLSIELLIFMYDLFSYYIYAGFPGIFWLLTLLLSWSYGFIGFSPDKWWTRKNRREDPAGV